MEKEVKTFEEALAEVNSAGLNLHFLRQHWSSAVKNAWFCQVLKKDMERFVWGYYGAAYGETAAEAMMNALKECQDAQTRVRATMPQPVKVTLDDLFKD